MREKDINSAISAWFEPKPELIETAAIIKKGWSASTKGFWALARTSGMDPEKIESFYWRPTDFLRSEDANARLLEAMPNPDLSRDYSDYESATAAREWRCDPFGDGELKYAQYHPDRKTAIVLAFCKFAGIEVTP